MQKEKIPMSDITADALNDTKEKLPFFATPRGKVISTLLMVLAIAAAFAFFWTGGGGSVIYQLNDDMIGVTCLDHKPVFVSYEEITSVKMVDTFEQGQPISVSEWNSGWCGTYRNETWGEYTLFAYSDTGMYIVIEYDGGVLVFNAKSARATKECYNDLMEKLNISSGS